MNPPLDRAWILGHIPHQGGMCLNDAVEHWDSDHLCCTALSHRDRHNPLRAQGRLSALSGVEYAAQAVAIHGALLGGGAAPGMLGSVRDLVCNCAWLDEVPDPLCIEVERLGGDAQALLYRFQIDGSGLQLLSGRLSIILGPSSQKR